MLALASCSAFFLSEGSCQRMTAKLCRPIVVDFLELMNTMLSVIVLSLDFVTIYFVLEEPKVTES